MPRPTVATLIAEAASRLPGSNALLDAEFLYRGLAGWSRSDLLARATTIPAPETIAGFERAVARRGLHEPVQYILGKAFFWHDEFMVTPAVLIPRPDTETLVEAVAARLAHVEAARLLDVGTGSGCIALSLLRELPRARALAVDVSIEALNVARQNAKALGRDDRIAFAVSNWLSAVPGAPPLDAIVSNPPYVDQGDEASLPAEVRDFEPALALFAEAEDDLSSYRAILGQIGGRLRPGGILALEVGHGQAGRVADLVVAGGFTSIEIVDDLASIPRVVIARQP